MAHAAGPAGEDDDGVFGDQALDPFLRGLGIVDGERGGAPLLLGGRDGVSGVGDRAAAEALHRREY